MCKSLEKLQLLTDNLPPLPTSKTYCGVNEVEVDTGLGFLFNLYNINDVSVVRGVLSKGTIIPPTKVSDKTWIIVFKGQIKINGKKVLIPGDYVFWNPGDIQSAESLSDSETITVTVPASKMMPKGD